MVNKIIIYSSIAVMALVGFIPQTALAFNKNRIIEQGEVAYNNITAGDIQAYFNSTGTQLASYTIPVEYLVYYPIGHNNWASINVRQEWKIQGQVDEEYFGRSVAELIAEWSILNKPNRPSSSGSPGQINPLIALATLDKESGPINGNAKNNILSNLVRMSWIMGYGYNGLMADCANIGVCNAPAGWASWEAYAQQRAIWYGGPGIQLVEGISALKRWNNNPTVYSSSASVFCDSSNWRTMRINGECLSLENNISYALYRYTPNFSGNQLFLNIYNHLKSTFPTPSGSNDTTTHNWATYQDVYSLTGNKRADNRAFFGGIEIAGLDTNTWLFVQSLNVGLNSFTIQYRDSGGNVTGSKQINVTRHKTGDINGDGVVDLLDLSILATHWVQTSPGNHMADTNGDGVVDLLDLSILAANWER